MSKNPTKSLEPGKYNALEKREEGLNTEFRSTTPGITGTNYLDEIAKLLQDNSEKSLIPDGNIVSALILDAVEIKLNNEKYRNAHACMIPRDLWNAFADNPGGFNMYKCRIGIDFKDCIKPAPGHITEKQEDMLNADLARIKTFSLAYGLFLKPPQIGELYDVKVLNKTKDFSGDEYIIVDKRAAYDFIKEQTMKQKLAQAGAFDGSGALGSDVIPSGNAADLDALTRTLLVETSFLDNHPGRQKEFAAICWLAINRANNGNISVADALRPPGRPTWNSSAEYRNRWYNAHVTFQEKYADAKAYVERLLVRKEIPNPIGARTQLVHPGNLPRCNPSSPCRTGKNGKQVYKCVGGRCMPLWSISKSQGGSARHEPIKIGKGIFS